MNILHLNDKVEVKGGVEVYIAQLMELLPKYDIQSHWVGIYKESISYSLKVYLSSSYEQKDINLSDLIGYIKNYIAKHQIDIIHIHSLSDPKFIQELFTLAPVVRSMHEPRIVCPGQGKFWRLSERICDKPFGLHCIYRAYKEGCCNRHPKRLVTALQNTIFETTVGKNNYKAIIAMSDYMMKEAKIAGYPDKQVVFNPYFTPLVEEKELVDTQDEPIKSILFVGRLSKTKGVHYLIEAAKKAIEKHKNIKIDIVGSGHDENYFKSLIPQRLHEYFIFHGWKSREEVHSLVSNAYIVTLPSIYPEAFGISGIEAMMRGKPVVGFEVGGVTTWLKNGKTGFLVPVKDKNAFAEKIKMLVKDKKLYSNMSQMSRLVAIEEFSPQVHMNKLVEIYMKIINILKYS